MASKVIAKKNNSGIQVIKTLQVLMDDNYTMAELVKKLNMNEKKPIFNHSVVSKYINTCRYCGISIPKIQNRYFIAQLPFGLELTIDDLDVLDTFHDIAKKKLSPLYSKLFDKFVNRVKHFSNKEILRVEEKTKELTLSVFEKAIKENRRVALMFRVKSTLDCIPISITETKDGQKNLNVKYKEKNKTISLNKITGIVLLDKRGSFYNSEDKTVVFKLTGELAKRYTLRENEHITCNKLPEYIVVNNRGENQEELLHRLLRYDSDCEIINPCTARTDMKNLIEKTLKNYEV